MIILADRLDAEAQVDAVATETVPETEPTPVEAPARKRGGGPRTEEGKASSRWNAFKHGMRAKVLMPEDMADAVAARKEELLEEFGRGSDYEHWLMDEMALASTRLERLATLSIADMRRTVDRAALCWDKDRMIAAEDLGARLPKNPSRVARALEGTWHGADWLIVRWEGLGAALKAKGTWDDDQRRLAFDLLGVPLALRDGGDKVPPETDAEGLANLVAREVARLRQEQEGSLDVLDEGDRAMAIEGLGMSEDAETARLRKYEASCRRALLWAHHELRRVRGASLPGGELSSSGSKGSRDLPSPPSRSSLSESALAFMADRAEAIDRAKFEMAYGRAAQDKDKVKAAVVPPPAPRDRGALERRDR
jgi:hypothetical protein